MDHNEKSGAEGKQKQWSSNGKQNKQNTRVNKYKKSPINSHIVGDSQVPGPSGIPAKKLCSKT